LLFAAYLLFADADAAMPIFYFSMMIIFMSMQLRRAMLPLTPCFADRSRYFSDVYY